MASNGNVLGVSWKCSTKFDHLRSMRTQINQGRRCHMCNKFLTLGFGHEQEEVLGFQGKTFFHVFGWGCLCTTTMEVFMALMILCHFLLFG